MKRLFRAGAVGLAATAFPAAAQEQVDITLNWREVIAGTNTPVPNPNGILEPGESARIAITASFSPPVGSPVSYTPPPPPGNGTMAGLGGVRVDVAVGNQTNPSTGGAGSWEYLELAPGWTFGFLGSPFGGGAGMRYIQAGQFVAPGATANSANPIPDMWQGVWTPSTYSERALDWQLFPTAISSGGNASIVIQYGVSPSGTPLYVGKFVGATYGSTTIPIIPAPASLLAVSALFLQRRRRGP